MSTHVYAHRRATRGGTTTIALHYTSVGREIMRATVMCLRATSDRKNYGFDGQVYVDGKCQQCISTVRVKLFTRTTSKVLSGCVRGKNTR